MTTRTTLAISSAGTAAMAAGLVAVHAPTWGVVTLLAMAALQLAGCLAARPRHD